MSMFKNVARWWYGLLSGFIGGGAGAVASAFGPMFIDPAKFNFSDAHGLANVFKTMAVSFAICGIMRTMDYLKANPLPPEGDDTTFIAKPISPTEPPKP